MKVVQIFKYVYILLEDVYHSIKHNHTSERMFKEQFWKAGAPPGGYWKQALKKF